MTAEVAILRAYALASQHRCSEAERMLGSVPDAIRSPSGADLLARIKFEQGDIDSARRIWEEVIRIQPDNEPAKKALECIDAPLLTKRLWGFCFGQKWTWLAIMAVLMGVSFSVGKALRSNVEQKEPVPIEQEKTVSNVIAEQEVEIARINNALLADLRCGILTNMTEDTVLVVSGGQGKYITDRMRNLAVVSECIMGVTEIPLSKILLQVGEISRPYLLLQIINISN